MYARSTTIITDISQLDRAATMLRDDVMPALMNIEGCIGLSGLIDRESGRCIATSAWESMEAMRSGDGQVGMMRSQFIDAVGGREPLVQEWDIPVMHRAHVSPSGAYARVSWLQGDRSAIDDSLDEFRMILPELDNLSGFCSASLLINRDTGLSVSTVIYDSAEAVATTRADAQALRVRTAQRTGTEVLDVAEFELAVAHLRVPELV